MTTDFRFHLLLVLALICMPVTAASAADGTIQTVVQNNESKRLNIGFRLGFESATLVGVKAGINDHRFAKDEYRNKAYLTGFAGLIIRYNFPKLVYFQSEILYNSNKSCLVLELDNVFPELYGQNNGSEREHVGTIMTKYRSIDIPVLIGFNLTNSNVYHLSAYCGPTLKIPVRNICETSFDGFPYYMSENLKNIILSGTIGINCKINTLFFDFSYNLGLTNMSESLEYDVDNIKHTIPVSVQRTLGYLSVAVGMLF